MTSWNTAPNEHRWLMALVLSCVLHAAVFFLADTLPRQELSTANAPSVTLELTPAARTASTVVMQQRKARKARREAKGQIVDLPKPLEERKPPKNARFLSKYDMRTPVEQKTRHIGRPKMPSRSPGRKERPADRRVAMIHRPSARRMPRPERKPGQKTLPRGQGRPEGPGLAVPLRRTDKRGALQAFRSLLAPQGDWGQAVAKRKGGVMVADDAILDVKRTGDVTLLNARSFKYFAFFERIKKRVRAEWDPATVYRARDPYGRIYGTRDRLTVLAVELDREGRVSRMEVFRSSGLPFLDKEALRAMKKAAPFLNPPRGLMDEDGKIRFKFGFLLDFSSSRSHFFWQRNW